ncbi:class I SAM-dependent methyltransferase [Roseobacter litoralis]|uniref:class I SAM-dependent methyltransferase n=1 Tax=Roseobacter litoralis TaxID=42443 RepID=UPI0024942DDC|nr:class I SAM-dependent methyltransferase [Roseobacter litoralis]
MTQAYWDAFFQLHRGLPREGPGEAQEVAWAAEVAGVKPDARICDAACGPGADIPALLKAAPRGHVSALDKVDAFVQQAQDSHGDDPRTTIFCGDMTVLTGPFDFIWCAGAVYFLGVTKALEAWRTVLAPGGAIAFSQVYWRTDTPSAAAQEGWADYPEMTDEAGLRAQIDAAGYDCVATRHVSDKAWEDYYGPLDQRISQLRPNASGALKDVLDEAEAEAALWRAARHEFGYLLSVVRPR